MIKYCRTPHLQGSKLQPGDSADGQIAVGALSEGELVWEEKIDGGNSGISFSEDGDLLLQSRGHYLTGGPGDRQFDLLKAWAQAHSAALYAVLGRRYLMFGEWAYAKHTVFYDRLPHYFLEFDIFDKERGVYLSTDERMKMLAGSPVVSVPVVHRGFLRREKEVRALIKPSLYKSVDWRDRLRGLTDDPDGCLRETDQSDLAEGLYLKHEKDGVVIGRYKFVRHDFLQTIADSGSHWAARKIIPNQLAEGVDIFQ